MVVWTIILVFFSLFGGGAVSFLCLFARVRCSFGEFTSSLPGNLEVQREDEILVFWLVLLASLVTQVIFLASPITRPLQPLWAASRTPHGVLELAFVLKFGTPASDPLGPNTRKRP